MKRWILGLALLTLTPCIFAPLVAAAPDHSCKECGCKKYEGDHHQHTKCHNCPHERHQHKNFT